MSKWGAIKEYAGKVGKDLVSGNKSIYEAVSQKKNPAWADKLYKTKNFSEAKYTRRGKNRGKWRSMKGE